MDAFIETRVLFFNKEITRCIKDPTVVSYLDANSTIPSDDCSRLKKLYLDGDPFKANEEMVNCLLKSTAKGKWRSFLDALERSEYLYLKSLLESTDRPQYCDDREKEIIRVFSPYLLKTVVANDIVTDLYSRKVIDEVDTQSIRAISTNKGEIYATIELLERMQCRVPPDIWFYEFLSVLVQRKFEYIVREIEPDFLDCPERYRSCKGTGASCENISQTELCKDDGDEDCCSMSGNIIEHFATDSGNAEEDMDEGVPVLTDDQKALDLSMAFTTKDVTGKVGRIDLNLLPDPSVDVIYERSPVQSVSSTNQSLHEQSIPKVTEDNKIFCKATNSGKRAPPEGQDSDCDAGAGLTTTYLKQVIDDINDTDNEPNQKETECNDEQIPTETDDEPRVTEGSNASSDGPTNTDEPLEQKLYPFQLELAENALAGKNTIICAPTGSGKTWVALYIMDEHLKMSANVEMKRKVVFMARNGALVKQQMNLICDKLPYAKVKHLVGNTDEAMMLNAFVEDYDIFLFTPQILVNNLNTDIRSISTFSLMVFDECHHTKGGAPYNLLMNNYLLEKENGIKHLPQIIGLTASIGTGGATSEKEALEYIFEVCASLDVRCLSTVEKHQEDLSQHVSVPTEDKIPMKKRTYDPCRSILLKEMKETEDILEGIALMKPKFIQTMHKRPPDKESKQYQNWTAEVLNLAEALARGQGRDIASCAKYLQVYCNALEVNRLLRTTDVAIYLATQFENETEQTEKLTKVETNLLKRLGVVQQELIRVDTENPNVLVMSKTLSNLFTDTDTEANESRAMIFVHARATCRALAEFLNEELKDIYVEASPLVGKDTRGTDKGMTEEEQIHVLESFREGKFKILVATSVGMEGIDVPDCNMTLNYNYSVNEITKIQMKGRSRKEKGKSVMIANDSQLEKDRIAMYRIKLMYGAVVSFKNLDQNSVDRKIHSVQKKMLDEYKWQLKIKELKRSKQSDEFDYEIKCRKCSKFVCFTSDVRKHETSYLVAVKGFAEQIEKEEHTKQIRMGTFTKKFRMFCTQCTNAWGLIGIKDGLEYFILKLENLKFVSSIHPDDATPYGKWDDVPYKFKEIRIEDLSDIYNQ